MSTQTPLSHRLQHMLRVATASAQAEKSHVARGPVVPDVRPGSGRLRVPMRLNGTGTGSRSSLQRMCLGGFHFFQWYFLYLHLSATQKVAGS